METQIPSSKEGDITPTLRLLVDYVMAHRRKGAFRHWDRKDLEYSFVEGYVNNTLLVSHDGKWKLNGLCLAKKDETNRILHVTGIITTAPGVLTQFFEVFLRLYPDYSLTGYRYGKVKSYQVSKLTKKLIV